MQFLFIGTYDVKKVIEILKHLDHFFHSGTAGSFDQT